MVSVIFLLKLGSCRLLSRLAIFFRFNPEKNKMWFPIEFQETIYICRFAVHIA